MKERTETEKNSIPLLEEIRRPVGDAANSLSDWMDTHAGKIEAAQNAVAIRGLVNSFISFDNTLQMGSHFLSVAQSTEKLGESVRNFFSSILPLTSVISKVQIVTAAINVFTATLVAVNTARELSKAISEKENFLFWLNENLSEYQRVVMKLENADQTLAQKKNYLENEKRAGIIRQYAEETEKYLCAEFKPEMKTAALVTTIRKKITDINEKQHTDEYSSGLTGLAVLVSNLSLDEKEYFYAILSRNQVERRMLEAEKDLHANLVMNVDKDNRETVSNSLQKYMLAPALSSKNGFLTELHEYAEMPTAELDQLKKETRHIHQHAKLTTHLTNKIEKKKKELGFSLVKVAGAACFLLALGLAVLAPVPAILLFSAGMACALIEIKYQKEFPTLSKAISKTQKNMELFYAEKSIPDVENDLSARFAIHLNQVIRAHPEWKREQRDANGLTNVNSWLFHAVRKDFTQLLESLRDAIISHRGSATSLAVFVMDEIDKIGLIAEQRGKKEIMHPVLEEMKNHFLELAQPELAFSRQRR